MPDLFSKTCTEVRQNCLEMFEKPMIVPTGFREYDARWRFPEEINLTGMQALGLALGTHLYEQGKKPRIVVGCDYRSYSPQVKQALMLGLISAGIQIIDIGVALSPILYFSQFLLDAPAGAMVTASHNPNGWTGIKIGSDRPLTYGPQEMARLKEISLSGLGKLREGGSYQAPLDVAERYLEDVTGDFRLSRRLRVVCAAGNGTAGAFAPKALEKIGAQVIPLKCELDYDFPHYNPNPESIQMLEDMRNAVIANKADLALGFDGDGDRCGVVDNRGNIIFSDKMGVLLAREYAKKHKNATFVADVKATGLFATDQVLAELGASTDYWKTGHSYMKRRVKDLSAVAGFEKSGHYFIGPPMGRGYDDGVLAGIEICKLLDRHSKKSLSQLYAELPQSWMTPTMSPWCDDTKKYEVSKKITEHLQNMQTTGKTIAGKTIEHIVTVNGARVQLAGGAWALVRPSSNTPNLVVVCESPNSKEEMRACFEEVDKIIRLNPEVGEYDQTLDSL